jgi:ATP-dependent helicase/nuclease subunit B
MLTLTWISHLKLKHSLWKSFEPESQIWVTSRGISDDTSFLRRQLLQKSEIISGNPLMLASEFWRKLLNDVDSSFHIMTTLSSEILARDFLERHGTSEWCQRPHAALKLTEACQSLSQLITHPEVFDRLKEFRSEFSTSGGGFFELAALAAGFYKDCCDHKRLPWYLAPHFLVQKSALPVSETKVIFDLGFEMTAGERDLIQKLSLFRPVQILIPAKDANELEEKKLFSYRDFDLGVSKVSHEVLKNSEADISPTITLLRCSSPMSEARKAIELVSQKVREGASVDKIAITALRIADYEDLLTHDLSWEGIPFRFEAKSPFSANRLMRALTSRLRISTGELNNALIEEAFLKIGTQSSSMVRQKNSRLLKPVSDELQISVDAIEDKVRELNQHFSNGPTNLSVFENILLKIFSQVLEDATAPESSTEDSQFLVASLFSRAIQDLRKGFSSFELKPSLWVEAWGKLISKIMVSKPHSKSSGVYILPTASVGEVEVDYLIILGLAASESPRTAISLLTTKQLSFLKTLGFDFSTKPSQVAQIQWLLQGPWKQIILSAPKSNIKGNSISASPLWLNHAAKLGRSPDLLDFAEDLTWLRVQSHILNQSVSHKVAGYKKWPQAKASFLGARLTQELIETVQLNLPDLDTSHLRLSASSIETYWQCPFKFYVRSMLKIFDESDLELEPSPQVKGQWLHTATETILKGETNLCDWTDTLLSELVDNLDLVQKKISGELWPSIRVRFVRQLRRFIDFEIKWGREYPRTQLLDVEAEIQGFITWSEQIPDIKFMRNQDLDSEGIISGRFSVPFRGSIDRIDIADDKSRAIIIDYKSGSSQTTQITSWNKNGSLQLALYTMAVEAGLLKNHKALPVMAAQFYSLKSVSRDKGFYETDETLENILPDNLRSRSRVTNEKRTEYFSEIKKTVHNVLTRIKSGAMTPKPEKETICNRCSWRHQCRAHHLL